MPRPPLIVALLALAVTCGLLRTAEAAPSFAHASASRTVLAFAPDVDLTVARTRLLEAGLDVHATVGCAQAIVVNRPADATVWSKVAKIAGVTTLTEDTPQPAPRVLSRPLAITSRAQPGHVHTDPNDEYFGEQWNISSIGAPAAWEYTTGATDALTSIAILDTGIDLDHPDLGGNVVLGAAWNFYDNSNDVQDISPTGSGTMVAGIIAAAANNGFAIAGLAWNTQIIPVKVIGWDAVRQIDVFYWSDVAAGICHAVDNGARVIHISAYQRNLGTDGSILSRALNYAADRSTVVVAPMGDEYQTGNPLEYPASYPRHVIAVGGVYQDGTIWEHSGQRSYIDLVAPGVDVVVTVPMALDPIGARFGTGTILAAAHVSGVALLMRSVNPLLSPQQISDIMRTHADDLGPYGFDTIYGAGLLNALKAVEGTPHRLAVSPADQIIFEWDAQSRAYRQPTQTILNNHTGARTWRTETNQPWLQVQSPTNASGISSTPSLSAVRVADPQTGACGTLAGQVRATSQMPSRANGPQDILVRVILPACPVGPYAVFLPLIEHAPPRPVTTSH